MKKLLSLFICFSIFFTSSSISYLEGVSLGRLKTVKGIKEIAIPSEFGKVVDKHFVDEKAPTIYCIRDIHGYHKVQLNISSILSSIYQNIKEPTPLYVEGAWGELPISFFREFPDRRIKGELAENCLENRSLTGPEFYAVRNPRARLRIIGVEDPELYQSHAKIYFKLLKQAPLLNAHLRKLKITNEFYELAVKRDRAMAENALRDMKKRRNHQAVLIAGGFHTHGLKQIFKEKKVNYFIIQPSLNTSFSNDFLAPPSQFLKPGFREETIAKLILLSLFRHRVRHKKRLLPELKKWLKEFSPLKIESFEKIFYSGRNKAFLVLRISGVPRVWQIEKQKKIFNFKFELPLEALLKDSKVGDQGHLKSLKDFWKNSEGVKKRDKTALLVSLTLNSLWFLSLLWFATSPVHSPQWNSALIDPLVFGVQRFFKIFFQFSLIPYQILAPLISSSIAHALHGFLIVFLNKFALDRFFKHKKDVPLFSGFDPIPLMKKIPSKMKFWSPVTLKSKERIEIFDKSLKKVPPALQIFLYIHNLSALKILGVRRVGRYYLSPISRFVSSIFLGSVLLPLKFLKSFFILIQLQRPLKIKKNKIQAKSAFSNLKEFRKKNFRVPLEWSRSFVWMNFFLSSVILFALIGSMTFSLWFPILTLQIEAEDHLFNIIRYLTHFLFRSNSSFVNFVLSFAPLLGFSVLRDWIFRYPVLYLGVHRIGLFKKDKKLDPRLEIFKGAKGRPNTKLGFRLIKIGGEGTVFIHKNAFKGMPKILQLRVFQEELIRAQMEKKLELFVALNPYFFIRRYFFLVKMICLEPMMGFLEWIRSLDLLFWRKLDLEEVKNSTVSKSQDKNQMEKTTEWSWLTLSALAPLGSLWVVLYSPLGQSLREVVASFAHFSFHSLTETALTLSAIFITYLLGRSLYLLARALVLDTKALRKSLLVSGLLNPKTDFFVEKLFSPFFSWISLFLFRSFYLESYKQFQQSNAERDAKRKLYFSLNDAPFKIEKFSQGLEGTARFMLEHLNSRRIALGLSPLDSLELEEALFKIKKNPVNSKQWIKNISAWLEELETRIEEDQEKIGSVYHKGSLTLKAKELFYPTPYAHFENSEEFKKVLIELMEFIQKEMVEKGDQFLLNSLEAGDLFKNSTLAIFKKFPEIVEESFSSRVQNLLDRLDQDSYFYPALERIEKDLSDLGELETDPRSLRNWLIRFAQSVDFFNQELNQRKIELAEYSELSSNQAYLFGELENRVRSLLEKEFDEEPKEFSPFYHAYQEIEQSLKQELDDVMKSAVENHMAVVQAIFEKPLKKEGFHEFLQELSHDLLNRSLSRNSIPVHLERSFLESWVWNLQNNELEEFLFRVFLAHKGFLGQTFYLVSGEERILEKVDSIFDICFKDVKNLEELKKRMFQYAEEMEKTLESVPGLREKANLTLLVKMMDQALKEENNREWKEILSKGGASILNSFWNPSLAIKNGVGSLWEFLQTKILGNFKNQYDLKQFERTFLNMQNEIIESLLTGFKESKLLDFKTPNFSQIILENSSSPEPFLKEFRNTNQKLDEMIVLLTQEKKFGILEERLNHHFEGAKTYLEVAQRYPAYIQETRELLSAISQKLGIPINLKVFINSEKKLEQLLNVLENREAALKREAIHPALSALFGENRDLAEPVIKRIWERVLLKNSIKFDLNLGLARQIQSDIKTIENSLQFFLMGDVQAIRTIGTGSLADTKEGLEASINGLKSHFLRIIHLIILRSKDEVQETKLNLLEGIEPALKEIKLENNPKISAQQILKFLQGLDHGWRETVLAAKIKEEPQSFAEVFWQTLWNKSLNKELSSQDIARSLRAVADTAFREVQSAFASGSKIEPSSYASESLSTGVQIKGDFPSLETWSASRELNLEAKELWRKILMTLNLMDSKNPNPASSLKSFLEDPQNHFRTSHETFKTLHSLESEIDHIIRTIFREKGFPTFGKGIRQKEIQHFQSEEHLYPQEGIHKGFEILARNVKEKFILFKESERSLGTFLDPELPQKLQTLSSARTLEDFFKFQENELNEFLKKVERIKGEPPGSLHVSLKRSLEDSKPRTDIGFWNSSQFLQPIRGSLGDSKELSDLFFSLESFAKNLEKVLGFFQEQTLVKKVRDHLIRSEKLDLEEFKRIYLSLRLEAEKGLEEFFKEKFMRLGGELSYPTGDSAQILFRSLESFSKEISEMVFSLSQEQKLKDQVLELKAELFKEGSAENLQSITQFFLSILPILDKAVHAAGGRLDQDTLLTFVKERFPFAHTPSQFRGELKYFILELRRELQASLEMDRTLFSKVLADAFSEPNQLPAFILGSKTLFQFFLKELNQFKTLDPDLEKAFNSFSWEGDFSLTIQNLQKRLMVLDEFITRLLSERNLLNFKEHVPKGGEILDESLSRILSEKKIPIQETIPKVLIEKIGAAKNLDELKKVYFRAIEGLIEKVSPLYKKIEPQEELWKGVESVSHLKFKEKIAFFLNPGIKNVFVLKLRSTGRSLADLFSYASNRLMNLIALSSPLGWLLTYLDFSSFAQTLMIFMASHEWGPYSKERIAPEQLLLPPSLKTEPELFFSNPFIFQLMLSSQPDLDPEAKFKRIQKMLSRLPEKTRNKIFIQFSQRVRIVNWSKSHAFLSAVLLVRFRWMRELIVRLPIGSTWF